MDAVDAKVKALRRIRDILSDRTSIILVEGARDKSALMRTSLADGNVFSISGKKPESAFEAILATYRKTHKKHTADVNMNGEVVGGDARDIEVKRVVLLTDFDDSGRKLAARWREVIAASGITIDSETPRKLRWVLGIHTIEDIPSALFKFEERVKSTIMTVHNIKRRTVKHRCQTQ